MPLTSFITIIENLTQLYLADTRPWLVGFSGGKDSTLVAALIVESILCVPPPQRNGEHTFNSDSLDDRSGILIGGQDGAGKTHLLRAA